MKRGSADDAARYGFRYGPCDVVRLHSDERGHALSVQTDNPRQAITIWISAKGNSVRVYDAKGRELE